MPTIKIREGDTFEGAMRKFKRVVDKTRILQELRLRESHLKGSVLKQRQKAAAKKRLAKKLARDKINFKDPNNKSIWHNDNKSSKNRANLAPAKRTAE